MRILVLIALTAAAATVTAQARDAQRTQCIEPGGGILWQPARNGSGYLAVAISGTRFEGRATRSRASVEQIACGLVGALRFRAPSVSRPFPYRSGFVGCGNHGRPTPKFEVQVDAVPGGHRLAVYSGHTAAPLAWAVTSSRLSALRFDPRYCHASP